MAEFATVARPYAKALYGLAEEQNKLKPWLGKLALITDVVDHPKVVAALAAPEISAEEQTALLIDLLATEDLDQELKNFISVVAEAKRLMLVPAIFEQYRELALSEEQTKEAVIYSAFPLEGEELKELVHNLETKLNTKLQVRVEIQPELIGGVKVEFGDQILDMSVQSKLEALYVAMTN